MKFPKKKWSEPEVAPRNQPEIEEDLLQRFADEYMDTCRIKRFRFTDKMWAGLKLLTNNKPKWQWLLIQFRLAFGGKMPDCMIYERMSDRYSMMFPLELKTQDNKGRQIGKLHGRQKVFGKDDGWTIARSPENIESELRQWIKDSEIMAQVFSLVSTPEELLGIVRKHFENVVSNRHLD